MDAFGDRFRDSERSVSAFASAGILDDHYVLFVEEEVADRLCVEIPEGRKVTYGVMALAI